MRGRRTFNITVLTSSDTVASVSPNLDPKSVKSSPSETSNRPMVRDKRKTMMGTSIKAGNRKRVAPAFSLEPRPTAGASASRTSTDDSTDSATPSAMSVGPSSSVRLARPDVPARARQVVDERYGARNLAA